MEGESSPRPGVGFLICLIGPLAIGVLLNALVRPGLAAALNGVRRASGSGVRSQDTWWTFEESARAAHPLLTSFLSMSNGAVAMWLLLLTALLLVAHWVVVRARRTRPTR